MPQVVDYQFQSRLQDGVHGTRVEGEKYEYFGDRQKNVREGVCLTKVNVG